jgi:hypothetical protein
MGEQQITLGEVYRLVQSLQADVKAFVSTRPCELHGTRLTVIETARSEEAKQAVRRSTLAGIIASIGMTGLLRAVQEWIGR